MGGRERGKRRKENLHRKKQQVKERKG